MSADFATVRRYFETDAVVHVATLMPDGAPHSVPVWVGLEGDRLAIFTQEGTTKDKNLQRDPRVAMSVTKPDEPLDMAFIRGAVTERLVGDEAMQVVDRISDKYTGGPYPERTGFVAFLITPSKAWSNDYSDE